MLASYTRMEKIEMEIFKKKIKDPRFKASERWDVPRESEILIVSGYEKWVSPELLDEFKRLKHVITRSAGYNHLPLDYLRRRGILAYRLVDYGSRSVAEHGIALMFALAKNLRKNEEGYKIPFERKQIPLSQEIYGSTLGIIGVGHIGKRLIEYLRPFGRIVAYSRTKKEIPGVEFIELERLLKESDVVFITASHNPDTHHLINKERLMLMKEGSMLINIARGEIINTDDLIWAMRERGLRVGLDVIENEQWIFEGRAEGAKIMQQIREIRALGGIVTPHNAYYSNKGIYNMVMHAYELVRSIMKDETIPQYYLI